MNELLQWSIQNSDAGRDPSQSQHATRGLSADALAQLFGGPSDADRMRDAMVAVVSPDVDLENKLIAFDNFEQLVENIDNANNIEPLGLWGPLIKQLENEEKELRRMAAWCAGTAVQNNPKAQERLLAAGGVPILVNLVVNDADQGVRKKAILALSSVIRNYQPGLDIALEHLPDEYKSEEKIDAGDMEAVDSIIQKLRDASSQKG
ncbi:putative Hsp70 nucleotide exchange factor [Eremomyces bilateralis CBS 781.70]|uniref:Hsp70 nucleotide exchange factor n=1 Tax=Eremomyces bilateralis CBS 781.70 TaxID=1392243 RepID=A0A6G1FYW7_9PEZI|nr:putative Hsp70 nucleotide exchange factor [Eremomyces bilateralis CBS 781.70]KAF1810968.1 putative Hsp70 nucleotide exchange factor [Eremomyces bilateralis CBS 781.70]